MKKELQFAKAKSKNNSDAAKLSEFCFDEIAHFIKPISSESYNGTKQNQTFDDEWRGWKSIPVPEDLSKEITKDTCKKLGI